MNPAPAPRSDFFHPSPVMRTSQHRSPSRWTRTASPSMNDASKGGSPQRQAARQQLVVNGRHGDPLLEVEVLGFVQADDQQAVHGPPYLPHHTEQKRVLTVPAGAQPQKPSRIGVSRRRRV